MVVIDIKQNRHLVIAEERTFMGLGRAPDRVKRPFENGQRRFDQPVKRSDRDKNRAWRVGNRGPRTPKVVRTLNRSRRSIPAQNCSLWNFCDSRKAKSWFGEG